MQHHDDSVPVLRWVCHLDAHVRAPGRLQARDAVAQHPGPAQLVHVRGTVSSPGYVCVE